MKTLILIVKGFFIGIAKIIPGVSGALLAITFNLYEQGLFAITNFFDNPKSNFKFLFKVGIGIILGIILFSKIVSYLLINYYFITMLFFIGLILGGIIPIIKNSKNKNYLIIIISFSVIYFISKITIATNYNSNNTLLNFFIFLISGIIDASATVIPGISGTALLMLMGVYNTIISVISNLTNIQITFNNLNIIIPYTIGMLFGLILISKIMNNLFKNYKEKTISFIIGISLSTIYILIKKTLLLSYSFKEIIIGILLFLIGYMIALKLDK